MTTKRVASGQVLRAGLAVFSSGEKLSERAKLWRQLTLEVSRIRFDWVCRHNDDAGVESAACCHCPPQERSSFFSTGWQLPFGLSCSLRVVVREPIRGMATLVPRLRIAMTNPVAAEIGCAALPCRPIGIGDGCHRVRYHLTGGCYSARRLYAEGCCMIAKNRYHRVRFPRLYRLLHRVLPPL